MTSGKQFAKATACGKKYLEVILRYCYQFQRAGVLPTALMKAPCEESTWARTGCEEHAQASHN